MSDDTVHHEMLGRVLERLDAVESENARLNTELVQLRASAEQRDQIPSAQGGLSRRHLLQALGGAAVAGAGLVAGDALGAKPATAADGDNLVLGSASNASASPTGLEVSGNTVSYGAGVTDNGLGSFPPPGTGLGSAAVFGHSHSENFINGVPVGSTAGCTSTRPRRCSTASGRSKRRRSVEPS